MTTNNQHQRIINLSELPLSWLLGSAAAMAALVVTLTWSASKQTGSLENKIDQLIKTTSQLEKRLDDRDTRIEGLRDKQFSFERTTDEIKLRIDALERARSGNK